MITSYKSQRQKNYQILLALVPSLQELTYGDFMVNSGDNNFEYCLGLLARGTCEDSLYADLFQHWQYGDQISFRCYVDIRYEEEELIIKSHQMGAVKRIQDYWQVGNLATADGMLGAILQYHFEHQDKLFSLQASW